MALTFAFRPPTDTAPHVPGDRRRVAYKITFDNSYPTGGEVVNPGDVGLTAIHFAAISGPTSAGKPVFWNTNKLQVFSAIGTEVANAFDLSAESVLVEFVGI